MRYFALFSFVLIACTSSKKKIKIEHSKEFAAKKVEDNFIKDTLITEEVTGFYESGNLKFLVGLHGFSNKDTSFYEDKKSKQEKHGDKIYFLDDKDSVSGIQITKGDSIFYYETFDLERPIIISIVDKHKNVVTEIRPIDHEITRRTNQKYDESKNPVYWVSTKEYYPDKYDAENTPELELQKKIIESRKYSIVEMSFVYY